MSTMPKLVPHLTLYHDLADSNPTIQFYQEELDAYRKELEDVILVLGGDGTVLGAGERFPDKRLIGIHYRRNPYSMGNLMNEASGDTIKCIKEGRIMWIKCYLLHVRLFDGDNLVAQRYAFNDFNFERADIPTITVKVTINGRLLAPPFKADGIVAASAAGSSAYSVNAHGYKLSLLNKDGEPQDKWVLTSICPPEALTSQSTILGPKDTVKIEILDTDRRPVRSVLNGQRLTDQERGAMNAIITRSDRYVTLGFAETSRLCRNFR